MDKDVRTLIRTIWFPIVLVVILWMVHFYNVYHKGTLGIYGIYPRAWDGLQGIFFAPFIHNAKDGFRHILSNSVPLFMLTSMIALFYRRVLYPSFILIFILTGFAVWMFGRPVYHIGASGVVYGLLSFVFWSGVFRRNLRSIILALVVTLVFNGYFLGLFPNREGVSWESHLFGALAGLLTAFLFKAILEKEEQEEEAWSSLSEPEEKTFFLPRDTFELTLRERREIELRRQEELRNRGDEWSSTST